MKHLGRCNATPVGRLAVISGWLRVLRKRDFTFRNAPLDFIFRLYLHHSLLGRSYKQFTRPPNTSQFNAKGTTT
jgi:hypothetical protein